MKIYHKGQSIEKAKSTKYLGIEFSQDGNLKIARDSLYKKIEGLF